MKQYLDALKFCYDNGTDVESRAGSVRKSFGIQMHYDLSKGFPAITTKKLAWKSVISELLWFIEGSDDERRLAEILYNDKRENLKSKKTIWSQNAKAEYWKSKAQFEGDVGKIYGVQWRNWGGKDQIKDLLKELKKNPDGRRHILSAWNLDELNKMALPPCHVMTQFYVHNDSISCHMYQRSADMFLGVPFNIASYALLLSIFGEILNLKPKRFIHSFGDAHIYKNSIDQVREQISRTPKPMPELVMPTINSIDDLKNFGIEEFALKNYDPHPPIKAKMAI